MPDMFTPAYSEVTNPIREAPEAKSAGTASLFVQVTGPARFFCAAEDCPKYMLCDTNLWCEDHWNGLRRYSKMPRIRNGMTIGSYRKLIVDTRAEERRHGWHVPETTAPKTTTSLEVAETALAAAFLKQEEKAILAPNTTNQVRQLQQEAAEMKKINAEQFRKLVELNVENYEVKAENHSLRELVKLFRVQVDSFMTKFQATIDGVH